MHLRGYDILALLDTAAGFISLPRATSHKGDTDLSRI